MKPKFNIAPKTKLQRINKYIACMMLSDLFASDIAKFGLVSHNTYKIIGMMTNITNQIKITINLSIPPVYHKNENISP